jgi:transaldolase
MHRELSALNIKIFADGADLAEMARLARDPLIQGLTTNPTLMRKAGVTSYRAFARQVLDAVPDLPVSFEVLSDDVDRMAAEARVIGSWGDNVYVKIPITNTAGESTLRIVEELSWDGIKLNVTAITTLDQAFGAARHLTSGTPAVVSVFAGRIADTGRDPVPMMEAVAGALEGTPAVELLWASPRELLNIFHAEDAGCHIITVTGDLLAKRHLVGKDLAEFSLDTVRMFFGDAAGVDLALNLAATGSR